MPQHAPQGTWTVESCTAVDNANNQATLDTSQIDAAGFSTTFDETDPGDSTAPDVTGFEFTSPTTVSVGSGDATITATAQATDDLSGLHVYMACQYVAPSGTLTAELTGYTSTPGALQADYSLSMTIPQYSQTGTWTLASCSPEDQVGNRATVTQGQMQAAGFPTTFTVQ
jgi:hypothetical protein